MTALTHTEPAGGPFERRIQQADLAFTRITAGF